MVGLELKKTDSYKFDETLCLICQKQKDDELNSTADGQTQVRKVTEMSQDTATIRIYCVPKKNCFDYCTR